MNEDNIDFAQVPFREISIVKVCGMRDASNIREVEKIGIDWMGFIFHLKSSRAVKRVPAYLPAKVKRVGVFVNESIENILETTSLFQLDFVQLHGDESPDFCDEMGKNGLKVIKAFSIANKFPKQKVVAYHGKCDYFLFDTKTSLYGGSGKKFDWEVLSDYHGETPFLLSGGISEDDAEEILAFSHPQFVGIDINSKFEISPALKDVQKISEFIGLLIQKSQEPRQKTSDF